MKSRIPLAILTLFAVGSLAHAKPSISLHKSNKALTLSRANTPILVYHTAEVPPPDGVDPIYRRSGFIHPMHAPSGGVVTGIHPDDHYHHLGLWHAWVKTKYGKHTPDFWNLGKSKTGRVRYTGTKEMRKAGFTVGQEQVAYLAGQGAEPTVILAETLSVDAAFVDGANVIDYALNQKNVAEKPLEFPAYRYGGGIAYRAPLNWNKGNSEYLTSKGLTRKDSHATRARWVAMFGPAENGGGKDATVVILCHPKNHDAPQRIRTWPQGKVFFNYVPVQETGWSIRPGNSHTLHYRIVIFDGRANPQSIEARWRVYTKS